MIRMYYVTSTLSTLLHSKPPIIYTLAQLVCEHGHCKRYYLMTHLFLLFILKTCTSLSTLFDNLFSHTHGLNVLSVRKHDYFEAVLLWLRFNLT
jgi:hypothetical protein